MFRLTQFLVPTLAPHLIHMHAHDLKTWKKALENIIKHKFSKATNRLLSSWEEFERKEETFYFPLFFQFFSCTVYTYVHMFIHKPKSTTSKLMLSPLAHDFKLGFDYSFIVSISCTGFDCIYNNFFKTKLSNVSFIIHTVHPLFVICANWNFQSKITVYYYVLYFFYTICKGGDNFKIILLLYLSLYRHVRNISIPNFSILYCMKYESWFRYELCLL